MSQHTPKSLLTEYLVLSGDYAKYDDIFDEGTPVILREHINLYCRVIVVEAIEVGELSNFVFTFVRAHPKDLEEQLLSVVVHNTVRNDLLIY